MDVCNIKVPSLEPYHKEFVSGEGVKNLQVLQEMFDLVLFPQVGTKLMFLDLDEPCVGLNQEVEGHSWVWLVGGYLLIWKISYEEGDETNPVILSHLLLDLNGVPIIFFSERSAWPG